MEIYILLSGVVMGPYSEQQVRQYLEEGLVTYSDLASYEGMGAWEAVDVVLARLARFVPPSATTMERAPVPEPESIAVPSPEQTSLFIPEETIKVTLPESFSPPAESVPASIKPKAKRKSSAKAASKQARIVLQEFLPLTTTASNIPDIKTVTALQPIVPITSSPEPPEVAAKSQKPIRVKAIVPPNRLLLKATAERFSAIIPVEPVVAPLPAPLERPQVEPAMTAPELVPLPVSDAVPDEPLAIVPKTSPQQGRTHATRWTGEFASVPRPRISAVLAYVAGTSVVIFMVCTFLYLDSIPWKLLSANRQTKPENISHVNTNQETAPAPEISPTTAADYDARGKARQAQGNFDGAIADFTQAIGLEQKDAQAYYQRGLARQAKGDFDGALSDYTQALELDPRQADVYNNRGFVKQTQGDFDGAVADYTQALLINPKIAVAFYNRGFIKARREDLDGAILDYNHALDLDPTLAVAYYNRGDAKYAGGNVDGAIADYTQAVTLNPKIALAYCHRGSARQAKGDADGATADYNQALALNPKMATAYYNRGLLREQKGDLTGAITDSTQAINLDPKDAQAYCNRGLARLGENDLDEAMSDLKTFCQMAPRENDADYARLYIWLISKVENDSNADEQLTTSLQADWNSTPEDLESKIAAFVLGHIDETDLLTAAASSDPSQNPGLTCKARYFIGMKRLLNGDKANAADEFRQCVATGASDYCEYTFAQAELRTMEQPQP